MLLFITSYLQFFLYQTTHYMFISDSSHGMPWERSIMLTTLPTECHTGLQKIWHHMPKVWKGSWLNLNGMPFWMPSVSSSWRRPDNKMCHHVCGNLPYLSLSARHIWLQKVFIYTDDQCIPTFFKFLHKVKWTQDHSGRPGLWTIFTVSESLVSSLLFVTFKELDHDHSGRPGLWTVFTVSESLVSTLLHKHTWENVLTVCNGRS